MKKIKLVNIAVIITCMLFFCTNYEYLVSYANENTKSNLNVKAGLGKNKPTEPIIDLDKEAWSTGAFTVKAVSSFHFQKTGVGSYSYSETYSANVKALGIEVDDLRGTGEGWQLQVKMESFKDSSSKELEGWKLFIPTYQVKSEGENVTTDVTSPKANSVELNEIMQTETILKADKDTGMGAFTNVFYQDTLAKEKGVRLDIPITSKKGSFTGKLVWSLSAVPPI
ncbi:hypothetical protein DOK67_0001101 [Enterococcus sp. DIV0212c]|uniref:WxL domain-containing protein n=1 Tax=Enterococcus sp. DIV0212c TaxID=2230867 RepID=UPI001A9C00B9|nr:WxL domain-containing protein [Enterococcus sp. DIV0212c]MBO1354459.1 WxL domain-containing protein [Enterococcus sp. DIV0212c]